MADERLVISLEGAARLAAICFNRSATDLLSVGAAEAAGSTSEDDDVESVRLEEDDEAAEAEAAARAARKAVSRASMPAGGEVKVDPFVDGELLCGAAACSVEGFTSD